jgi:DNA-binding transcriptional LysR family regulator
MDRLHAMSLFVASVEGGSFSAAGRKLGVPLPTVSRNIAELEAHLRTRLLVRSTRKLTLTDTGTAYLAACKRILEEVGAAERIAAGEYVIPRGDLTLTAPIVFGRLHVVPIVCDFLAQFADINVRMVLSDRNLHLIDDQIDMAVRIGALPDSTMVATRVGSVRRVVCASPGFLAAHEIPKTPEALADLPCITFDGPMAATAWTFVAPNGKTVQAFQIRRRLAVNTAEAAIDAAIAGVGLAQVLSYQAAGAVADGKLRLVLRKFECEPIPVSVMHAGQGPMPLKMRTFLDFAVPRLRKALTSVEMKQ